MAGIERLAGGGEAEGRRTQRILVRSQLDDGRGIETELTRDYLDGAASFVDGLGEDGPIG
jgi:hypothetical protein